MRTGGDRDLIRQQHLSDSDMKSRFEVGRGGFWGQRGWISGSEGLDFRVEKAGRGDSSVKSRRP
eukprot:8909350-Pyramimonas_sp.AAC.1